MDPRRPGIRPRLTLWRRLDLAARHVMPACLTLVLLVIATAPFGLPAQAPLLPAFALGSVFYWTIYRPIDLAPPVVFLLGLFADLLGLAPMGVMLLTLLLLQACVLAWRRALLGQKFLPQWLAFALLAAAASLLDWLLFCLLSLRLLPPEPMIFQMVIAVALYPALAALLRLARRAVPDPIAG
jgi:rod shape-determining protein MreD